MKNQLFTYAIKDGQYVSIDEFAPGEGAKCGCICPECGEPVRSNVTAKTKEQLKIEFTNHFSHIDDNSICSGGYEESWLHLKAKKLISSHTEFYAPGKSGGKQLVQYNNVRVEKIFPNPNLKKYRPDVIIKTIQGVDVVIEIVVTNPVSVLKENLYKENRIASLVIDLFRCKSKSTNDIEDQLKFEILESTNNKRWIWNEVIVDDKPQVLETVVKRESSIWDSPITWILAFFGGLLILGRLKKWLFRKLRR